LFSANNNVISVVNNNSHDDSKSTGHVTPVKVMPQLIAGDAVITSPARCVDHQVAAVPVPGLVEVKTFNHAQPVYYNQAQCVPLYGQYPGLYDMVHL